MYWIWYYYYINITRKSDYVCIVCILFIIIIISVWLGLLFNFVVFLSNRNEPVSDVALQHLIDVERDHHQRIVENILKTIVPKIKDFHLLLINPPAVSIFIYFFFYLHIDLIINSIRIIIRVVDMVGCGILRYKAWLYNLLPIYNLQ